MFLAAEKAGLKIHCNLAFHGYKNAEGDALFDLPHWLNNEDITKKFYLTDINNQEYKMYISWFADKARIFESGDNKVKRTPLEMYQ